MLAVFGPEGGSKEETRELRISKIRFSIDKSTPVPFTSNVNIERAAVSAAEPVRKPFTTHLKVMLAINIGISSSTTRFGLT